MFRDRAIVTLILGPLVLLVIYRQVLWAFLPLVLLIGVLALKELYQITDKTAPALWHYWPAAMPLLATDSTGLMAALLLTAIIIMLKMVCTGETEAVIITTKRDYFALVYLVLPLALLVFLELREPAMVLFVLAIVWGGDIGAYLVGRRWGAHPLMPTVSPKKSHEGYWAGALIAFLSAGAVGVFLLPGYSTSFIAGSALLMALVVPFGDLFESRLKRAANVKDSGHIIPGHGGVLDRIDSLLLALPLFVITLIIWGYF